MSKFSAFRIYQDGDTTRAGIESLSLDDLSPGDVVIRAAFSSINFKDALAATGKGKILRRSPLVGGIDVSGIVESCADPRFASGDQVLVTGCGLSEVHDGGYSEVVRVPADWVIPLPDGLSLYQSMALGTAGFTAGLALLRMEQNGLRPDLGPILVSGASGGVGSIAVNLFANLGYDVAAMTGKADAHEYLQALGASELLSRHQNEPDARPLEKSRWGGAVDSVGGETLAWLTRSVAQGGSIASIGMVGGDRLHTTVMPFILRSINLLGISSANCPMPLRTQVWQRLAVELPRIQLDRIVTGTVALHAVSHGFEQLLEGKQMGRTVVQMAGHNNQASAGPLRLGTP